MMHRLQFAHFAVLASILGACSANGQEPTPPETLRIERSTDIDCVLADLGQADRDTTKRIMRKEIGGAEVGRIDRVMVGKIESCLQKNQWPARRRMPLLHYTGLVLMNEALTDKMDRSAVDPAKIEDYFSAQKLQIMAYGQAMRDAPFPPGKQGQLIADLRAAGAIKRDAPLYRQAALQVLANLVLQENARSEFATAAH